MSKWNVRYNHVSNSWGAMAAASGPGKRKYQFVAIQHRTPSVCLSDWAARWRTSCRVTGCQAVHQSSQQWIIWLVCRPGWLGSQIAWKTAKWRKRNSTEMSRSKYPRHFQWIYNNLGNIDGWPRLARCLESRINFFVSVVYVVSIVVSPS